MNSARLWALRMMANSGKIGCRFEQDVLSRSAAVALQAAGLVKRFPGRPHRPGTVSITPEGRRVAFRAAAAATLRGAS